MAGNDADKSSNDAAVKALREKAQQLLAADHFAALGLKRTAGAEDVGRAFVQAAKTWHPDRAPKGAGAGTDDIRALFAKVFARLDIARVTLSDASRRAKYLEEIGGDKTGHSERQASNADISTAEAGLEFKKAEALLKKNDAVGAEEHLRRAVQLAPTNVEFQAVLISLQAQKPTTTQDDLVRLAGDLDRLITRNPDCERAYMHRGQIRKRLDRLPEAHADFVRAVKLNPNNVEAAREIRIYTMRHGDKQAVAAMKASDKEKSKPASDGGGGFFKKLFKR